MEIEPIETWLRAMGCTPVRTESPTFRWSLRFDFPASSNHIMEALSLPSRPGSVLVLTKRSIDTRLVSAYDTLSEGAKEAFHTELTSTLLDRVFHGLADPTRLLLVERLCRGPASVSDLTRLFAKAVSAAHRRSSIPATSNRLGGM